MARNYTNRFSYNPYKVYKMKNDAMEERKNKHQKEIEHCKEQIKIIF